MADAVPSCCEQQLHQSWRHRARRPRVGRFTIVGEPAKASAHPPLLSSSQPAPHLARFVSRNPDAGGLRPNELSIERERFVGDHQLVAKLPVDPRLTAGETQSFSVPLDRVLLFDADDGHAVGPAA